MTGKYLRLLNVHQRYPSGTVNVTYDTLEKTHYILFFVKIATGSLICRVCFERYRALQRRRYALMLKVH